MTRRNLPFLSNNHISHWDPPYLKSELTDQQRDEVKKRRRSQSSNVNRLLGNLITWGMTHVALDQFTIIHLFQYLCNTIRLIDCYGIGAAEKYQDSMIGKCKQKIDAGHDFKIGSLLATIDERIVTEMRITMIAEHTKEPHPEKDTRRRQPDDRRGGGKDRGKDRGFKGGGKIRRPPFRARPSGKASEGKGTRQFICFEHDPRHGKECTKESCLKDPKKLHLDTKQPDLAARFDQAKSKFDAGKGKGKSKRDH